MWFCGMFCLTINRRKYGQKFIKNGTNTYKELH